MLPVFVYAQDYFPLPPTGLWTLRADGTSWPVTVEVVNYEFGASTVRFRTPWSDNVWRLAPLSGRYRLTGYGVGNELGPVPGDVLFFDFTAPAGASWTTLLGNMDVVATDATVTIGSKTYEHVVRQRQTVGGMVFTYSFAPNVGLVEFDAGPFAFVLDESSSRLALPQHPLARTSAPALDSKILAGVTLNTFANEPATGANYAVRYNQIIEAGVNFISGAFVWNDLEPVPGTYNFSAIDFQVSEARRLGHRISLTLRLIDTHVRRMPADLQDRPWSDPEVERRALALVDALVARFGGQVDWFMFGNEIDQYFAMHTNEVADFAALLAKVKAHVKAIAPAVAVSTTLTFYGADASVTLLKDVDASCDVLTVTYYPMQADFTVQDPAVAAGDFARMRLLARGRGVLLQEIGYPTDALNASSQQKQAQFYSNVFAALRANRDVVDAGNFFMLADFSDAVTNDLAYYYGLPDVPVFKSFLQTLGMFDVGGNAKASWTVFTNELAR